MLGRATLALGLLALGQATACTTESDERSCKTNADCLASAPHCDAGVCVRPAGHLIGWGNGASLYQVYAPERPIQVTDLAFHPERTNELWILRRELASTAPCDSNNATYEGCTALEGTIAVVFDPGKPQASAIAYKDPNAWHFMRRPPAFAFGAPGTFATAGEARTGNYLDEGPDYIGPTLWSSALPGIVAGCESSSAGCFSVQPDGLNGSHLDMLHDTAFGMGIAHEQANIYWLFNGKLGALDRYDFHDDHGPGNDDHSDGELHRYVEGQLTRLPDVPSHMVFDAVTHTLYVADTGAGRIVALDTSTGADAGPAFPNNDSLVVCESMDGAFLTEVVPPGRLVAPSGLELYDDLLYVTDNGTGHIHAFDRSGKEVRELDTGLGPGALAGFTVGPDGKAYIVDMLRGVAFRIDPK